MDNYLWVVLITTLISFCFYFTYRVAYIRGYKRGAYNVLNAWKETINQMEEIKNEQR